VHVNPTGRKQCVNKRGLYQLLFSMWEPEWETGVSDLLMQVIFHEQLSIA
jgi:hypothetical protein